MTDPRDTVETPPPFTDAELDELEKVNKPWADHIGSDVIADLISEVRRLRSDEWLEKAAEEIGDWFDGDMRGEVLAALRKHRDAR